MNYSTAESSEQHNNGFNPSVFGLENVCEGRGVGRRRVQDSACYVIKSELNSNKSMCYRLVVSYDIAHKIKSRIGDKISYGNDPSNGVIYLWAGDAADLIRNKGLSTRKSNPTYSLAMTHLGRKYVEKFGDFKHLYLTPEFNADHIVLVPSGRD